MHNIHMISICICLYIIHAYIHIFIHCIYHEHVLCIYVYHIRVCMYIYTPYTCVYIYMQMLYCIWSADRKIDG